MPQMKWWDELFRNFVVFNDNSLFVWLCSRLRSAMPLPALQFFSAFSSLLLAHSQRSWRIKRHIHNCELINNHLDTFSMKFNRPYAMSMSISRNRLVLGIVFFFSSFFYFLSAVFCRDNFEAIICYVMVEVIHYIDDTYASIHSCAESVFSPFIRFAMKVLFGIQLSACVCLCKRKRCRFHRMRNAQNVHNF